MVAFGKLFFADFKRGKHGEDDGDVFRSGALTAFLFAAEQERIDFVLVRHFEKAHAARAAEFVRRAAEVIAIAEALGWHFAEPLDGVAEERDFVGLADGEEFAPGLDDAGLVVCRHNADEAGARVGHLGGEPFHVHHAVVGDGNQLRAFAKVMLRRVVDAGMLNGADPDFGLRVERLREVM